VVGGLVALVARSKASASAPATPLVVSGDRVVLVGDSIGQGLAPHLAVMLPSLGIVFASSHAGVPLVVKSLTATGLLPLLKAHAAAFADTRTAILSIGSNDAATNDPATEAKTLQDIVAFLRDAGVDEIVWASPPNFRLPPQKVPSPATAAKQNAFDALLTRGLVDRRIVPSDAVVSEIAPDRVHLTPAGYSTYASQIAVALTEPA